jgi:hypothetical protein
MDIDTKYGLICQLNMIQRLKALFLDISSSLLNN